MFCNKKPTVIAFTKKLTCPPCQLLEPTVQKLMEQDGDKFYVIQIDASDHKRSMFLDLFGIQSVPTILVYFPHADIYIQYDGERDVESIVKFVCDNEKNERNNWDATVWTQIPSGYDGEFCSKPV